MSVEFSPNSRSFDFNLVEVDNQVRRQLSILDSVHVRVVLLFQMISQIVQFVLHGPLPALVDSQDYEEGKENDEHDNRDRHNPPVN